MSATPPSDTCPHCGAVGLLKLHESKMERYYVCHGCARSSGHEMIPQPPAPPNRSPFWWVVRCDIGGEWAYLAARRESRREAIHTTERQLRAATLVSLDEAHRQRRRWRKDARVVRVRARAR